MFLRKCANERWVFQRRRALSALKCLTYTVVKNFMLQQRGLHLLWPRHFEQYFQQPRPVINQQISYICHSSAFVCIHGLMCGLFSGVSFVSLPLFNFSHFDFCLLADWPELRSPRDLIMSFMFSSDGCFEYVSVVLCSWLSSCFLLKG